MAADGRLADKLAQEYMAVCRMPPFGAMGTPTTDQDSWDDSQSTSDGSALSVADLEGSVEEEEIRPELKLHCFAELCGLQLMSYAPFEMEQPVLTWVSEDALCISITLPLDVTMLRVCLMEDISSNFWVFDGSTMQWQRSTFAGSVRVPAMSLIDARGSQVVEVLARASDGVFCACIEGFNGNEWRW
eukprot:CAMPEP_0204266594 /NCGR_PEP_ID=MMETSP0468-20130131/10420_1 /ASSEMBLY_ACC=CAM_ASM_000383 /TAXON_ID=2969 /ORGANISM="Oxyrrhis marina" /LENGTH=186 /DNA_ID=CAMNT_0051241675 /DNA_START=54 /DNA_END=611 /DNA_ORIENTATION=+